MRQTQKEEDQKYEDAKQKFFHCTDVDNQIRDEQKKAAIEQNSVFNLKKQFLLESNQCEKPKHHYNDNIDFMTSNNFYHSLTKNSVDTQMAHPTNSDTLSGLDPEVFELAAKKQSKLSPALKSISTSTL